MDTQLIVILALIVFVFGQQVFFSFQLHRLTDKLMSRDFGEYIQGESYKIKSRNAEKRLDTPKIDPTVEAQARQEAQEMNRLIGAY